MGVLRFITMSYKTKSEQSECKIHDPMISMHVVVGKGTFHFLSAPP